MPESIESMLPQFFDFLRTFMAALVILVLSLYLSSVLSRLIRRSLERQRVDPAVTLIIYHFTRWGIIIVGTAATLRHFAVDLTGFLAGLGIVGFTLGFALQDISRNIIAGMLLLVQRPFEIGDLVEIEGYLGRIKSVDIRSTEIVTLDGNNVLIPNGNVFTVPIINYSRESTRRIELTVGVHYESDLEMVRHTALHAVQSIPDVLSQPAPSLFFHTFNDSSIDFTVRYWIDTRVTDPITAVDPCVVAIQHAFARKSIEIPYPIQTEIQLYGEQKVRNNQQSNHQQ